jgi:hypothetical protein
MTRKSEENGSGFDEAFRQWGRRPPRTAPEVASTRIVAHLGSRTGRALRWRLAVAVAMLLGIPLALWLVTRNGEQLPTTSSTPNAIAALPTPASQSAAMASPPLEGNVVLSWLDPETPVYFMLSPPDSR